MNGQPGPGIENTFFFFFQQTVCHGSSVALAADPKVVGANPGRGGCISMEAKCKNAHVLCDISAC